MSKLAFLLVTTLSMGVAAILVGFVTLQVRAQEVVPTPVTRQPALYRIGEYSNPTTNGLHGYFRIFWFETDDAECYVAEKPAGTAGISITCRWKEPAR
jgi:hypothetical protein